MGDDGVAGRKRVVTLLLLVSFWLVYLIGGTVVVVMRFCVDWFFLSLSLRPWWLWSSGWAWVPYGQFLFLSSSEVGLGCVTN